MFNIVNLLCLSLCGLAIPHTSEDNKLFKKMWMYASRHIRIIQESKEETAISERVNGSLSATVKVNFEIKTVMAAVQSVSTF